MPCASCTLGVEMKVAFYKGTRPEFWPGLYNKLVRKIDGGIYSHCEIVFSDGVCWSASFMDKGVRPKTFEMNPDKWDLIQLPSDWDEAKARAFAEDHDEQPYSLLGNFKFIRGLRWLPIGKGTFCTMFGAAVCNVSKPELGWTKPWWFGPRKLFEQLTLATTARGGEA